MNQNQAKEASIFWVAVVLVTLSILGLAFVGAINQL